jgi:hypothetical protein
MSVEQKTILDVTMPVSNLDHNAAQELVLGR